MISKNSFIRFLMPYILFIFYSIGYIEIAEVWDYYGFSTTLDIGKVILSISLLIITNVIFVKLHKTNLYYQILAYCYYLIFLPQLVFFTYNNSNEYKLLFIHSIFLGVLFIFSDKVLKSLKFPIVIRVNPKNFRRYTIIVLILLLIPFFQTLKTFNPDNFNPYLVYLDRLENRSRDYNFKVIMDYTLNGITRVLIPVFSVYFFSIKKYTLSIALISIIVILFATTGGLKSMLLIVPATLFFINKSYNKISIFLFWIPILVIIFSLLEKYILDTFFISDILTRRIFFLPPLLETFYLETFPNYLFYQHSIFSNISGPFIPITKIIGERYFSDPEMSANIGLVVEGYLNFGYAGVIFQSFSIGYLFRYVNSKNIPSSYFGIIFVLLYVLNTSFFFPFLITHGFLVLLLILPMFNYQKKNKSFNCVYD